MKRALYLTVVFIALVSLFACGDTEYVDLTTKMKQEKEWKEQATEISLQLQNVLSGKYDIDVNVYNSSGSISVHVEMLSDKYSKFDFGDAVRLLGNWFVELPHEHSEYSFDYIDLCYYITNRQGNKWGSPSERYILNADDDGSGRLISSSSNTSIEFLSPDEVPTFLSK